MSPCTVALPAVVGGVLKAVRVDGDEDVYPHGVEEVCDGGVGVVFSHQPLHKVQQHLPTRHLQHAAMDSGIPSK